MTMNGERTEHPGTMNCPHCHGTGKAVNDYHTNITETCYQCGGKKQVTWEGCATCKDSPCSWTKWNSCGPRGSALHYDPVNGEVSIDFVPDVGSLEAA